MITIKSIQKRLVTVAAVLALMSGCSAWAAVNELPVVTVGGKRCFYYDVQPNESIYTVSNKLGVTRQQIVDFNPSVADGLKPRMRLFFPVDQFDSEPGTRRSANAEEAGVSTHTVRKGETVYGIARQHGMSPDYLVKLNPWAEEGIAPGQVLRITEGAPVAGSDASVQSAVAAPRVNGKGYIEHEIQPGETLFSIVNAHGVALESVLDANPSIDPLNYKAGEKILIPATDAAKVRHASAAATTSQASPAGAGTAAEILRGTMSAESSEEEMADVEAVTAVEPVTEAEAVDADTLQVAVMLPFMLGEEPQSRTTQLYTEFFKGMLMAADTLRTEAGAPVNFRFYDTAANMDTVAALLRRPEIAGFDLIVAPDNQAQLKAVADAADEETLILNVFAVKDESYTTNRNMVQVNIPHDRMYTLAIDAFMKRYEGRLPVFISRTGGQADKDSFVSELKERLQTEGRDFREISFQGTLYDADLAGLNPDEIPVVFVPNSGSKNEFARFVGALTALRQGAADSESVTIFGYPEWVTFRGDSFDEISNLGATIYSRFLVDERDYRARELKERYKQNYGVEMFEAVPTQGILGFDIGRFIIEGLRHKAETGVFPTEFNGVQNSMRLGWALPQTDGADTDTPDNEHGLVNETLFLLNFTPGGIINSERL